MYVSKYLVFGKVVYRDYKFEVFREQFGSVRVHQTVRLSDGAVCNTDDISNFFLSFFSGRMLEMPCILQLLPRISTPSCYKKGTWKLLHVVEGIMCICVGNNHGITRYILQKFKACAIYEVIYAL